MKIQNIFRFGTAGFSLLATAAFMACTEESFVRDAGELPGEASGTPSGALYLSGSFDPQLQDLTMSEDRTADVVYRLTFPAQSDVTVTLEMGNEFDVEALNDALGLKDDINFRPEQMTPYKRYRMLPETNFELPTSLTLTIPKGKSESAPLSIGLVYDETLLPSTAGGKRMMWPWMLPLRVKNVTGSITPSTANQMLGVGIRPANMSSEGPLSFVTWENMTIEYPRNEPFTAIVFADCRRFDPSCAVYYYYIAEKLEVEVQPWGPSIFPVEAHAYPMYDIECLKPAFLTYDQENGKPILQPDPDLLYVLNHQERYINPQRSHHMKICVAIEIKAKSPLGLCNLSNEARASLVWQIKDFVERYRLDGVSLNDNAADYTISDAPAVDKASYTKFLKELRTALGGDKLILVSYDADANSALYEAHDGLQAGDYIDYAWWSTAFEICTPYADQPTVQPIAGLDKSKFGPISADAVDTEEYRTKWFSAQGANQYPSLAQLRELYDKGECPVGVNLNLRANQQGFYEGHFPKVAEVLGMIPLHEGNYTEAIAGWESHGDFNQEIMKNLPHFGAYGSGLKDW